MKKFATTFALSLVFAIGVGAIFPLSANAAKLSLNSYVVQLNVADASVLAHHGATKVQPVFPLSADSELASTYRFKSTSSLDQVKSELANVASYVELDQEFNIEANKDLYPNDPGFSKDPKNIDRQWGFLKTNVAQAWKKTMGSRGVIVAVIDTGLDGTHEDFKSTKLKVGYDVEADVKISGRINSDDNGHGTLITGVIAASANNKIGIAGAAPSVSIMPIKALDAEGSGSSSDIAKGIIWAADHDADVINLSLGGIGFAHNKTLANAISYAFERNIVIVSAAGNDVAITGGNLDKEPVFPICNDNGKNMVIGVTATDVNDLKPAFANYGKACVDVSAPGRRILSTINHDPATGADSPDSYAYASGTSLAVPLVSAQAALLRSLFTEATNRQIRDRILSTAVNIDNLNLSQCAGGSCKGLLGTGRIDIEKSLEEQIVYVEDGDVVHVNGTEDFYYINGGKKQKIIPFVRGQRFAFAKIKTVTPTDLETFSEGSYAEPLDGTLIKSANDGAVYIMQNGLRSPVTYQVFLMRGYKFSDVATLTNIEVGSWVEGSFLTPPDGTIIRSTTNPTIYWVVNSTLHPVNYKFYIDRELNKIPVTYTSEKDITKFPKGDPYIL